MMLVIDEALCIVHCSEPKSIYKRACRYFNPDFFGGFAFEPSHGLRPAQQKLID